MKTKLTLVSAAILLASTPVGADQVIADDLIVQGSICTGFDCTNGYNFGFDTLVLRENNLRIFFDDTSNSASFPNNDWRLVANDTSNGGANRFSIEDATGSKIPFTIEAGTRSNQLYVDSAGRVGFGTNAPVVDLHVKQGNTPTLRLEQDGSSGFTAQTYDIAANEANFFIRDVTNGSKLFFRAKPGAPADSIFIKADGDIGLGTDSPTAHLHIYSTNEDAKMLVEEVGATVATRTMLTLKNNGPARMVWNNADSGISWKMNTTSTDRFVISTNGASSAGQTVFSEDGSGNALLGIGVTTALAAGNAIEHWSGATLTTGGVWTSVSTRSKKKNIKPLDANEALEAVRAMEPVTYEYKAEAGEEYAGFIAEDVPEIVARNDRKSLNSMDIVAVLTKVVQDQDKRIQELQDRLDRIESK